MQEIHSPRRSRAPSLAATAIALAATLASGSAQALILDTGDGPDYGGGLTLAATIPGTTNHQSLGGLFVLAQAEEIQSLEGWMNWNYSGRLTFSLAGDATGSPGAVIYSTTVDIPVTTLNQPDWRGAYGLDWTVAPGSYWLEISVPAGDSAMGSMPDGPVQSPLTGYAADDGYSGGWYRDDALELGLRLTATNLPEPGAIDLVGAGALALVVAARLRRRAA